jgi:deoxyribose-phosphate aldolase
MERIESIALRLFGDNESCKCGGGHVICIGCDVCRAGMPDQTYNPDNGIASIIDATILKADAAQEDVYALCDLANDNTCASVCVNSHFSQNLTLRLSSPVKSCTVINFPLGAGYKYAVAAEALAVINTGIQEMDMVQNLSAVKSGDYIQSFELIRGISDICRNNNVLLKVILETCYLSDDEIIICSLYAKKAGADFVKTSTGFGTGGATFENVRLMRQTVGPKIGVKASGGIKTREQALSMIEAGANRIGASNVLALL